MRRNGNRRIGRGSAGYRGQGAYGVDLDHEEERPQVEYTPERRLMKAIIYQAALDYFDDEDNPALAEQAKYWFEGRIIAPPGTSYVSFAYACAALDLDSDVLYEGIKKRGMLGGDVPDPKYCEDEL